MTQGKSQVKVLDLLSMQKFARLCETTPRTIRFYQQKGLLEPEYIDPFTQYRYFNPEQARKVLYIKLLQNFHIPLKEIKQLLQIGTVEVFLEKKVQSVAEEIEDKKKELVFLKKIQSFLVDETAQKKELCEDYVGPYTLLCMLIQHGRYNSINNYVDELFSQARRLGIQATHQNIVFYHDPHRYRPNDSTLEIGIMCLEVPTDLVLPKGLYIKKFQKQKVLAYTYNGPLEYLTFIHKRMVTLTEGKNLKGVPFDLSIDNPWNKKSPYDYLTKVGYPVETH